MKAPPHYTDKYAQDPSVQGEISVADIIKRDWERNYAKKSGISLDALENVVRRHVDSGGEVYRIRNTLFLVVPEDGHDVVKMHSLTADVFEIYAYALLTFVVSMGQEQGTQELYSYVPDMKLYNRIRPMFRDFLSIEDAKDDPDADSRYRVILDVDGFMQPIRATMAQQRG
jgi:hypothetical protein